MIQNDLISKTVYCRKGRMHSFSRSLTSLRLFLLAIVVGVLLLAACSKKHQLPPNIILITTDDMGHDDLAGRGNIFLETPNLNQLESQSVRFSNFCVSSVCAPTRASLLTGRQFFRTGVSGVHGGRDFMNLDETTVAEVLRDNGYSTGMWGKWHSGKAPGYFPWDRGFDEAYYAELYHHENNEGWLNGQYVEHDQWASAVVTDYALDFIRNQKDRPFFAYLSYLAPHEPWEAPEKYVQPYLDQGLSLPISRIMGMLTEVDFEIGRLLRYLENNGLDNNTIIIFMSDNGPWWSCSKNGRLSMEDWQMRNPSGLRGHKGQNWQNGIQVPMFMRWPGQWQPADIPALADVTDIFPTVLDIAGIPIPSRGHLLDGISLIPLAENSAAVTPDRQVFFAKWHPLVNNDWSASYNPVSPEEKQQLVFMEQPVGIRDNRFKLILNPPVESADDPRPLERWALFDLENDPRETVNIVLDKPEIAAQLKSDLRETYGSIQADAGSFTSPVFVIDTQPFATSWVNAYGPAQLYGNAWNSAHYLKKLEKPGDGAKYQLDVRQPGNYILSVEQLDENSAGISVRISIDQQEVECVLNGDRFQDVGEFNLQPGRQTLEFRISSSLDHSSGLNRMRRFHFRNAGLDSDVLDNPLPW